MPPDTLDAKVHAIMRKLWLEVTKEDVQAFLHQQDLHTNVWDLLNAEVVRLPIESGRALAAECSSTAQEAGMLTETTVDLRCSSYITRMVLPARGEYCQHPQCFDLNTFRRHNDQTPRQPIRCLICSAKIEKDQVVVDEYMCDILRHCPTTRAVIHPDGSWTAEEERQTPSVEVIEIAD